jgi:hypothetical protein
MKCATVEIPITPESETLLRQLIKSWENKELNGDASMIVLKGLLYKCPLTPEDIKWAENIIPTLQGDKNEIN